MFYLLIIIWVYENFMESVDYTQYGNTLNFVQIVIKPLEYLILEFIHSIYLFFVTWVISYEVLFLLCGTNSFIEFKYFTEHNKFQCKIIMLFLPIRKFSCPFSNTYCFTTSSKMDIYYDHFLFETLMIESTYVCNLTQFM